MFMHISHSGMLQTLMLDYRLNDLAIISINRDLEINVTEVVGRIMARRQKLRLVKRVKRKGEVCYNLAQIMMLTSMLLLRISVPMISLSSTVMQIDCVG